ncbi:MAG: phosphopantetheinyl transferase-like protein [Ramlibacter sp.]|nr:phosphopantetheinyl transferase-like protein [Ramlibacter sp.]
MLKVRSSRMPHPCELEVWTARPGDFDTAATQDLHGLLDDGERARAARFRHEADRRSYVVTHALRRLVLARWLEADPQDICFSQEPGGRPVLLAPSDSGLYFSHSRSREAVACAVTKVAPVGVDVEAVRADAIDEQIISRFVAPDGAADLARDQRVARFYFQWTALEAFWKAQGQGLSDGNPRIECRRHSDGQFEVWLEGHADGARARLIAVEQSERICATVAICSTAEVRTQLFNANAQLFTARQGHEMLSAG